MPVDACKKLPRGQMGFCFRVPCVLLVLLAPRFAFSQQAGTDSRLAEGASLYSQQCAACHGLQGKGAIGPSLQANHDPQQVIRMLQTGKGIMPSFVNQLSSEQIEAVASYVTQKLAVVSLQGGSLSEGGVLYRQNCSPCHRTAVRGGALAFAKTNAPPLIGLSGATIAGAIRSGPGTMPSFPSSVFGEKQLASIVRYVQFMQHPPNPGGLAMNYYGPVAEGLVSIMAVVILAIIGSWIEARGRG